MTTKSLETKIRIEVAGANLVIEDLDIDIKVKKTNEATPNTCTCEIWNLSDKTNKLLKDKTQSVAIYVSKGGADYILLFEGVLRSAVKRTKKKKKPKKPRKSKVKKQTHYNEPSFQVEVEGADVKTILELEDGHKAIVLNPYFSKSYDGIVSNQTIINDCISNFRNNNVAIGAFPTIPEKTYVNGKTYHGSTMSVLNQVLLAVNCKASLQNGVLSIINKNQISGDYLIQLDSTNCARPETKTDNEIEVESQLLPAINPNDQIYMKFKNNINGVYRIYQVEHDFDNYGKKESTKLVVKEK